MAVRKSVLIPVVPLSGGAPSRLLEIVAEPVRATASDSLRPCLDHLVSNGLGAAVSAATEALLAAGLFDPSQRSVRRGARQHLATVFLANPMLELSNSEGAALGIALGLLMHRELGRTKRLLATGMLNANAGIFADGALLCDQLAAAFSLGPQPKAVPFVVPTLPDVDGATRAELARVTGALAALNIRVVSASTLREAVAACGHAGVPLSAARSIDNNGMRTSCR